MILFTQPEGIYRVSANGGSPELMIETGDGERFSGPQLLPNGKGIMFTAGSLGGFDDAQIVVQPMDPAADRKVVWNGSDGRYVSTGHLTYTMNGNLFAIAFDLDTLEVAGGEVPLEQGLAVATGGGGRRTADYALSDNGSLVYRPGGGADGNARTLVWADRQGNEEAVGLEPGAYYWPRLSPDGTGLAVAMEDSENEDVWVSDLTREPPTLTKLTVDPSLDSRPIWTLDGERIVFASQSEAGQWGFFSKRADGTGPVDSLIMVDSVNTLMPFNWSPDGSALVFGYTSAGGDIGVISMDGDRGWTPLFATGANEWHPAISPNGDWIAYDSDLSGEREVYVERFPDLGNRVTISTGGGEIPLWSADGQALFFRGFSNVSGGALMVAAVDESDSTIRPGVAEVVLEPGSWLRTGRTSVDYDYDSVNERFLIIKDGAVTNEEPVEQQIITVLNWFEELKERVSVP